MLLTQEQLEYLDTSLERISCDIATIYPDFLLQRKLGVADTTWAKGDATYNRLVKNSKLDRIPLDQLKLKDSYDFLNHCLEVRPNMKKKNWSNTMGLINKIIDYALGEDFLERNPFNNLRPKKDLFTAKTYTREGDTVFTKAEQNAVCIAARADALKTRKAEPLGIVLDFNLGLRIGELCALKWSDAEMTLQGEVIHIQREMTEHIDPISHKKRGFEIVDHCKTPAGDRKHLLNDAAKKHCSRLKSTIKITAYQPILTLTFL